MQSTKLHVVAHDLSNLQLHNYSSNNLNEENKTFKFERHVSATPVPSQFKDGITMMNNI